MVPGMAAHARKILIGFDGSEASRRALDVAARLTGYGSTLAVVSVARDDNGAVTALLEEAHERLLGHQVPATYLEKVGEPAEEIVEAARELDADLVVVGSRSGSMDGSVAGSVSVEVLRAASCDVLVIR
jgi:nucleotide-binding universal stress UspA family protein